MRSLTDAIKAIIQPVQAESLTEAKESFRVDIPKELAAHGTLHSSTDNSKWEKTNNEFPSYEQAISHAEGYPHQARVVNTKTGRVVGHSLGESKLDENISESNRDTLDQAGMEYVSGNGNEHILKDKETGKKEVWFHNPNHASYGIKHTLPNGKKLDLEFASSLKESDNDTSMPFKKKSDRELKSMSQDELVAHHKDVAGSFGQDDEPSVKDAGRKYLLRLHSLVDDENLHRLEEALTEAWFDPTLVADLKKKYNNEKPSKASRYGHGKEEPEDNENKPEEPETTKPKFDTSDLAHVMGLVNKETTAMSHAEFRKKLAAAKTPKERRELIAAHKTPQVQGRVHRMKDDDLDESIEKYLNEEVLIERYSAAELATAHDAFKGLADDHPAKVAYANADDNERRKLLNHHAYISRAIKNGGDKDKIEARKVKFYNHVNKLHGVAPKKSTQVAHYDNENWSLPKGVKIKKRNLNKLNRGTNEEVDLFEMAKNVEKKASGKYIVHWMGSKNASKGTYESDYHPTHPKFSDLTMRPHKIEENIEIEAVVMQVEGVWNDVKPKDGESWKDVLKDMFDFKPKDAVDGIKTIGSGIKKTMKMLRNPIQTANAAADKRADKSKQ